MVYQTQEPNWTGNHREASPTSEQKHLYERLIASSITVIFPTYMIIKYKSHSERLITFLTAEFDSVPYYLIKTHNLVFVEDDRVSTSS